MRGAKNPNALTDSHPCPKGRPSAIKDVGSVVKKKKKRCGKKQKQTSSPLADLPLFPAAAL
jgi:hypothetical protein